MGFTESVGTCLRKYVDFNGRAQRSEYWWFVLAYTIVAVIAGVLDGSMSPHGSTGPISLIFTLALLLPSLAVSVRRMHDTNRSGWWVLISVIPIVGVLVFLYFAVQDGTAGANRFGADPKGRTGGGEPVTA